MGVKTENVVGQAENIVDDVSNESVKTEDAVSEDTMAALKAKLAKKNKVEENIKAALEKVEGEKMPVVIVEKKKRSLNIGVIGSGQAGSRIAEALYSLNYSAIAINTASQDLEHIKIPEDNKLLLNYGIGGASKELQIGHDALETNRDAVAELISDKLGDAQIYLAAFSLGGGSGSGSCEPLLSILAETGKPIVVITILPLTTDDAVSKSNALQTLSKLTKLAQNKTIANLIVVDNAKIEEIYADVGQMDFFRVSNNAIVHTIDVFNKFSAQPSANKSLDSMEFAKLFTDGQGLTIYGELTVHNFEEETAIAEAVIENLNTGLLATGFDLKQTRYAGTMIIAHPEAWSKIPSSSVNYALALINETCPQAHSVFKGLYEDTTMSKDIVKVYSMFSGLGLPTSRIDQLKKEAQEEMAKVKNRDQSHNLNLKLDTGVDETTSKADHVRDLIKKKSSSFSKNFTGVGVKDFRKK